MENTVNVITGNFAPPFRLEIIEPESQERVVRFVAERDKVSQAQAKGTADILIYLDDQRIFVAGRARVEAEKVEVIEFETGKMMATFEKRKKDAGTFVAARSKTKEPSQKQAPVNPIPEKPSEPTQDPQKTPKSPEKKHKSASRISGVVRTASEGKKDSAGRAAVWAIGISVLIFVIATTSVVVYAWKNNSASAGPTTSTEQKGVGENAQTRPIAPQAKPAAGQPKTEIASKNNLTPDTNLISGYPESSTRAQHQIISPTDGGSDSTKNKAAEPLNRGRLRDLDVAVDCSRSGSSIRCSGYFKSAAREPEHLAIEAGSTLLDSEGYEALTTDVNFGINFHTTAIPDHRINFDVTFPDKSHGLATTARLNLRIGWKDILENISIDDIHLR